MDRFDAGAKWWRDTLQSGAKQDNGDKSETGFMVKGMLGLLADRIPKMTDAEADVFQSTLAESIRSAKFKPWDVGVDYHPDEFLSDAYKAATGREAGAPPFPIKTYMTFRDDGCQVSYGYRSEPVTLWPVPEPKS